MGAARRNRLWIGLALACAVCALVASVVGGRAPAGQGALVATESIEAGTNLEDAFGDGRVEWRTGAGLRGLVASGHDLAQLTLARSLEEGEPVALAALEGSSAPPTLRSGERLVSVPIAAAGAVTGALRPGSLVDLASSAVEGPIGRASLVARGAAVVSVETRSHATGGGADGVVVRVDSAEALAISEALAGGRDLRLIVRPRFEGP